MKPVSLMLDSHVYIWLVYESHRLGREAKKLIEDAENLYLSQASLIELTFKHGSGKLLYTPSDVYASLVETRTSVLAIDSGHLKSYAAISLPYKDPFDRLLIAQSETEHLPLLTADTSLLATSYNLIDARQ